MRPLRSALLLAIAACRAGARDPGSAAADPAVAAAAPSRDAGGRDAAAACDGPPPTLGPGPTAERWQVDGTSAVGSSGDCLDLVRVDLSRHHLRIFAAARDGGARPAPRWADDFGLVAATNLSMFKEGGAPVALAVDARGALR